jgi:hypothetical protein
MLQVKLELRRDHVSSGFWSCRVFSFFSLPWEEPVVSWVLVHWERLRIKCIAGVLFTWAKGLSVLLPRQPPDVASEFDADEKLKFYSFQLEGKQMRVFVSQQPNSCRILQKSSLRSPSILSQIFHRHTLSFPHHILRFKASVFLIQLLKRFDSNP